MVIIVEHLDARFHRKCVGEAQEVDALRSQTVRSGGPNDRGGHGPTPIDGVHRALGRNSAGAAHTLDSGPRSQRSTAPLSIVLIGHSAVLRRVMASDMGVKMRLGRVGLQASRTTSAAAKRGRISSTRWEDLTRRLGTR